MIKHLIPSLIASNYTVEEIVATAKTSPVRAVKLIGLTRPLLLVIRDTEKLEWILYDYEKLIACTGDVRGWRIKKPRGYIMQWSCFGCFRPGVIRWHYSADDTLEKKESCSHCAT